MFKNTASQKLTVVAFADAGHATLDAGEVVTGDAANISCKVEQDDDGTQSATNDVAPTEVEDGQYRFDLTQAETNGNKLTFYPQSSTAGVQVVAIPSNVIYTRPPNFAALGIETDGDVTKCNLVAVTTTNTDVRGTDSALLASSNGSGLTEAGGTGDHLTAVPDTSGTTTLLSRLPAAFFAGITSLAEWLGLMAGDQVADATALAEIKLTGAGSGAYDESTDSQEAIAGAGGGGAPTVVQIREEMDSNSTQFSAIVTDTGTTLPALLPAALVGGRIDANVGAISEDTTAAANLELQYDGSGLTGDEFPARQDQLNNISVGSGGVSTISTSDTTVTTGAETLTYAVTDELDSTYHEIAPVGSVIDMYYEFAVGGNGVPQSVEWDGYVQSNGDNVEVYFWNWVGASWDQVETVSGANGTTRVNKVFKATTAHVGTGADIGKVRLRFASSGADIATNLATDRILCTYAVVAQSVGYALGRIWFDSVDGTDGSEVHVNGVADNPCKTYANITSLFSSLTIHEVNVSPESTFAPSGDLNNANVYGVGYTLTLGGHDYAGTHFFHASPVTGVATSSNNSDHLDILDSIIGAVTVGEAHFTACLISGDVEFSAAGAYRINNCRSGVAGAAAPIFRKGAAVGAITLECRDWHGGITLSGLTAGDVVTIDGVLGTVTLNGADANVEIRGTYKALVNNLTGSPTVDVSGAILGADVASVLVDTGTTIPGILGAITAAGPTKTEMDAAHALLSTPAQVLTQINAALDTAIAELAVATPSATPSLRTGIMLMYMALRNMLVVQTSGTDAIEIYNDAGVKIASKPIADDGADYTESEMV